MPSNYEQLVLKNGLRVQLQHEARLKRAAAFLRVAAGSHDAPLAWPDLVHALEQLFFLGTERFPADQSLRAYVQRQGGQANVRTGERTTDFFFELPPQAFCGALERLCKTLAHPRMAHAGNRYRLPVQRQAFQQSLHDFYRRFYHTGQMTLCLVGPQPLAQLQALAQKAGACLTAGQPCPQLQPAALRDDSAPGLPCPDGPRFNLLFSCEGMPAASTQALDFLGTWIANAQPAGLLAELRRRGLAESLNLTPYYRFAEQLVVNIEFKLTPTGQQAKAQVSGLCFDWLEFFESQDDWQGLREEYALLQRRQRQVNGALELARHATELFGTDVEPGLSDLGLKALRALLGQLRQDNARPPLNPSPNSPSRPAPKWHLPQRNRFLRPSRCPDQPQLDPVSMHYLPGATGHSHEAALYLRWRLNLRQHTGLWQMLDRSLHKLTEEARQAGVQQAFSQLGDDWQLCLTGIQDPMPALIEQTLEYLTAPGPDAWRQAEQITRQPPLIPIRELIKRLPEHCVSRSRPAVRTRDEDMQPLALQKLWTAAQWDGLALGLEGGVHNALNAALCKMPGRPNSALSSAPTPLAGRLWHQLPSSASEQALLLFCPTTTSAIADEAAWRMLAQLCLAPFYQKLRVELKLGYAVFSRFRQVAGRAGLLFGVQSPNASLAEILGHLETFLTTLPELIHRQGDAPFKEQCEALAKRFTLDEMEVARAGETLWQANLAGHSMHYLEQLHSFALALQPGDLLQAAEELKQAAGGWLCLANGPPVDARWQVAK